MLLVGTHQGLWFGDSLPPRQGKSVVDALSPKGHAHTTIATLLPYKLAKEFYRLNIGIVAHAERVTIEVEPTLEQNIRKGQVGDAKI
jgi:hypothetical protein